MPSTTVGFNVAIEGWDATTILIRLGLITVLSVATGLIAWRLYVRWKRQADDPSSFRESLSLDGLRAMRERGELTEDEFRILRDTMLKQIGAFDEDDVNEQAEEAEEEDHAEQAMEDEDVREDRRQDKDS